MRVLRHQLEGRRHHPGRRRVLFFGTYDAVIYPRVRVLREGFEAVGDEVIECNEPLEFPTALRVRMLSEPWLAALLAWRLAQTWMKLWWRAWRLGYVDLVVVGYMGQLDVHLARRLWPSVPIVLDHLVPAGEAAVDRRCNRRWLVRALAALDSAAIRTADIVCVDTLDHLRLLDPPGTGVVVPVGAPGEWFAKPSRRRGGALRVVFFGSFTPLQGAPVIAEAASLLADGDIEFTFIGRGQDWEHARALVGTSPRVRWVDWVEPDELPGVVSDHDVVLGIFGTSEKALRVVPTKVFQGAAAGAAIVTSDTAPQRVALGTAAAFVPPGDARALAATLTALAVDRERVDSMRRAAHALALGSFRPAAVIASLVEQLEPDHRTPLSLPMLRRAGTIAPRA